MESFTLGFFALLILAALITILGNFREEPRYSNRSHRRRSHETDDYYPHDDYDDPYQRRQPIIIQVGGHEEWRPRPNRISLSSILLVLILAGLGWMYISANRTHSSESPLVSRREATPAQTAPVTAPVVSSIHKDPNWTPTSTSASTLPVPEPRYPHREPYLLIISTFEAENKAKTALKNVAPLIAIPGYTLYVSATNRDRHMLYIPTRTREEAQRLKAALDDHWEEVQRFCPDLPRIMRVD